MYSRFNIVVSDRWQAEMMSQYMITIRMCYNVCYRKCIQVR